MLSAASILQYNRLSVVVYHPNVAGDAVHQVHRHPVDVGDHLVDAVRQPRHVVDMHRQAGGNAVDIPGPAVTPAASVGGAEALIAAERERGVRQRINSPLDGRDGLGRLVGHVRRPAHHVAQERNLLPERRALVAVVGQPHSEEDLRLVSARPERSGGRAQVESLP